MAAAVGDYRPVSKRSEKIHSARFDIALKKNKDLLKELNKYKNRRITVGFSLEDTDQLKRGKTKLMQKGLDLVILNSVRAIGRDETDARIMRKNGRVTKVGRVSKWELANKILDECIKEMHKKIQG